MLGLLEIFYSPGSVFDRVRLQGTWGPPFLFVVLMALVSSITIINMVGLENVIRKQIESNPQAAQQLGPDGIEKRVQMANTPVVKVISYVSSPVLVALMLLAVAGLLLGALSLSGTVVKYQQVLGITAYAWFPFMVIGTAMAILVVVLSTNREDLDLRNLVATNVGTFLDRQTVSKPLYSVATSLDLLTFGQVGLLSYGLSKVSTLSFSRCLFVVTGLWLI